VVRNSHQSILHNQRRMDLESDFLELEHLILKQRVCKTCGIEKDLLTDYYKTRKDRGAMPSAFSYECKSCTKIRIKKRRKSVDITTYSYPDW